MTNQQPRVVLWDMDGTLLDSAELHWLSWRDTLEPAGRPVTHEKFVENFGRRNDAVIRGFFGDQVPEDEIARIAAAKEERYRELVRTHGIELLPGVRDWLTWLHEAGWRQAIASSAPRLNIETILAALAIADHFEAIVSGEDVHHNKQDPEVFLTAARRLGVPPARCVVVEDAVSGIEGARRAGMRSLGVGPAHLTLPADLAVRSLAELPPASVARLLAGPVPA